MQQIHNPIINLRYWVLISLASIFGTNTGDIAVRIFKNLFDPEGAGWMGVKHVGPLPFLVLAFIGICLLERNNQNKNEFYFWSAIILIRSAATNIADSLYGDLKISFTILVACLSITLAVLAIHWQANRKKPIDAIFVPDTTKNYWFTMLVAGVLGTVIGDELWHSMGLLTSSLVLSVLMAVLVYLGYKTFLIFTALYWFGIVFARIAGTAVGDWLAKSVERGGAGLTLEGATLFSGLLFILTCLFWKNRNDRS